jgi:hypothetical protein
MSHMEPQVEFGTWVIVDGPVGTEFFPASLVGKVRPYRGPRIQVAAELRDYCENREAWSIEVREGWGARLSAPGYLDVSPWMVFQTREEAEDFLADLEN